MSAAKSRLVRRKLRISPKFWQIDMLAVVHNAEYIRWFDEGRLQFALEILPLERAKTLGIALMVVENHCRCVHYATLGDRLVLHTDHRVEAKYSGRFMFEHSLVHEESKTEIANGTSAMIAVDFATKRLLRRLPDEVWENYLSLS